MAGASLANALGSRGIPTLLIERLDRERHGARGDLLHPPTLRILDSWGVLDALRADGAVALRELVVSTRDRGIVARYPTPVRDQTPAGRTIAVPHERIEAVLSACAERRPSVTVERAVVTGLLREGGRVVGVRVREGGNARELRARVVIGCDGTRSSVRRELGIAAEEHEYATDFLYLEAEGEVAPPAAVHWHLDRDGIVCVFARPRGESRAFLTVRRGMRTSFGPDPALRDHVVGRFPDLARLRIAKARARLYRVVRLLAERFWVPGCALAGDAAHTTNPAGATGMSLAITGAARLAGLLVPALDRDDAAVDEALAAYEAERRPAAVRALEAAHAQAMRIYESDLFRDADAFARAVDPAAAWTAGGAGWGEDPAALAAPTPTT